jgi:hypothetical protein
MGTRPRPRQAVAAAAGEDGAREARTGPKPTRTRCDTFATARLRRGRPLTTLQSTKRQPATAGVVEQGGRVTTARRTTTSTAPRWARRQFVAIVCTSLGPFPNAHASRSTKVCTVRPSRKPLRKRSSLVRRKLFTPSVLKDSLQPHGHARLLALPISCHRKSSDTSQVNAATSGDWEVDRQKSNAAGESNLDHRQAVARHEIGRHDHRGCLRALGHTVAQRYSRCTRNDRISRACWPSWDKLREDKLRESSVY